MSKTRVAVQSRGPGHTHREGPYLQLGSPAASSTLQSWLTSIDFVIIIIIIITEGF